jgi:GAF domain-containing protein
MQDINGDRSGDRERLIASAVVEIGAGNGGGAIEAAHALARWSMRLLDVSGAGVMLTDDRGVLRSVIASSDLVGALEAAELRYGRGPCVESHRRARAVIHADVHVADVRWLEFGLLAHAGGVRAAHAIPVLDDGAAIGVLNLFRATTGGLDDPDAALAGVLADAAGAAIGQRPAPRTRVDAHELTAAVADAALIQRATGMLAVRL